MNDERRFEEWKRAREREPVPDGFADSVMAGLVAVETVGPRRLARVILFAAAGVVALARVAALLALFATE